MPKNEDTVTNMAVRAQELESAFDEAVPEVTGQRAMSVDDMAHTFLGMTFQQRATLFTEVLASEGADGLEKLRGVFERATEIYGDGS